MKTKLLSFKIYKLILIFISFYGNVLYAQSVTPAGSNTTTAEVGIANYFTFYANMPTGATITINPTENKGNILCGIQN